MIPKMPPRLLIRKRIESGSKDCCRESYKKPYFAENSFPLTVFGYRLGKADAALQK